MNRTLARLHRMLELARIRGFRRTLAALRGYLFASRRCYVFCRSLATSAAPGADEFSCRLATPDDLNGTAGFMPYRRPGEFRDWLDRGYWVFLAFDEGRPVAFQCLSPATPAFPLFSRIPPATDQVWVVDTYTLPEYRERGVAEQLRAHRDRVLGGLGYRESVAVVPDDNLPALTYAYGGGIWLAHVQRLTYFRFLWVSRIWLEEDVGSALEAHLGRAGTRGLARST